MLVEYPEILNVDDVMEILRMSRGCVYSLLTSGKLKSFRNGRVWKIPRDSVKQFIIDSCKL